MANYLYNGVELPKLPEWDKEAYPYAFMVHKPDIDPDDVYNDESYVLLVTALRPQRYSSGSVGVSTGGYGYSQHYTRNDPFVRWNDLRYNGGATISAGNDVFWANTDILNEDGSVYLAASTPVPVTDHNARIMGWIVGKRLAAQRGRA